MKPNTGSHKCYHPISLRVCMNLCARLTSNCIYSGYPRHSQLAFSSAYHFLFIHALLYHHPWIYPLNSYNRDDFLCSVHLIQTPITTCLPRHVDRWAFSSFLELMNSPLPTIPWSPKFVSSYLFSNQSWEHYFWRLLSTIGFKIWLMFSLFQCANS